MDGHVHVFHGQSGELLCDLAAAAGDTVCQLTQGLHLGRTVVLGGSMGGKVYMWEQREKTLLHTFEADADLDRVTLLCKLDGDAFVSANKAGSVFLWGPS